MQRKTLIEDSPPDLQEFKAAAVAVLIGAALIFSLFALWFLLSIEPPIEDWLF